MFTDNSQLPVSEFIKKMAEFRNSPNQRERDILNCVIKNLFDEFKFFNEYPEYELRTTAEVYGGFINEGIVQNLQFATAVRRVIEAIHAPPDMPLFTFGIVALEACKSVLHRYPKVCIMIKSNESFARFPEPLKEFIKAGCESRLPSIENMSLQQVMTQAQIAEAAQGAMARTDSIRGASMMMVSNMDILEKGTEEDGKTVVLKEESLVEEVSFMCNNLSLANLASKVDDLKRILDRNDDTFRQWLAQYLVMKRITLEQNFHSLYNAFLLSVDDPKLNSFVKQETLRNIKILLKSDKRQAASNFSDRQLLKNLGHWLGLITLARNQPIFLEDLNLRDLLLEAFYKGQQELLFVIPFVVKVIISASKSIVFQPSCAWINQILQILAEIHRQSDLKLNLKFEIEVLCKELHVTLDSLVGDSSFLQDTERITHLNPQLSEVAMLTRPELQGSEMGGGPYDPTGRASVLQAGMYPQQPQNMDGDIVQNSMASYYQQNTNQPSPPVAHFNYIDINIYDNIEGLIVIPPHLTLNQMIPNLSQHLRHAIATAVREIITGIVERSVTVALSMTSDIILKDFNCVSNEQQMRRAYLQMMRSTTAAIGMITTREPLATSIVQYTRQILSQHTQSFGSIPEMPRYMDEVLQNVIEHNLEMASCYIVKTACEKATQEIEKKMEEHVMRRKNGIELESFEAPPDVKAVIDRMPSELLPRNRDLSEAELQVYDHFTTQMCGFKPATIEDLYVDFIRPRGDATSIAVADLEGLLKNLTTYLKGTVDIFINRFVAPNTELHTCCSNIRQGIIEFVHHQSQDSLISLIDRLTEGFLISYIGAQDTRHQVTANVERTMIPFCEIFTSIVSRIMSHAEHMDVIRIITRVAISMLRDRSYLNADAYDVLIRHRMVNLAVFDQLFSRYIESMEPNMMQFIQKVCRALTGNDTRRSLVSYLPLTVQQLKTVASRTQTKAEATPYGSNTNGGSAYDMRNVLSAMQAGSYSESRQDGVVDDLFGYRELPTSDFQCKVEGILREWMTICHTNEGAARSVHFQSNVLVLIKSQGIPLTLDSITKFIKACLDICLDVCYRLLKDDNPNVHQRCNHTLDAFCRLMCVLVKNGDSICSNSGNVNGRITLLHKVLDIFNSSLISDHDTRRGDFSGFPFYRIFHTMLAELCIGPNALRDMKWTVLEAFGHAMFYIQPRRAPAFSYHWLDIVGHRQFISQLLAEPNAPPLTRAIYTQLLVSLLKFLAPSLRNVTMSTAVQSLYKGTLRVMLIVLHDFPELLCEYYYILCDVIPPNCIQLRNLVLSAYPRNMRLPDPFGQSFDQIQLLPEMEIVPKIPFEMFSLIPEDMRAQLDAYLTTRNGVTFLSELANKLETGHQPGLKYNIPVLNAIVSYVGVRAIQQLKESEQRISISTISHSAYMDVYQSLAISFCSEGRYILFNALANQLRYPNAQTHYFACALLYLFSESKDDRIKEQITRIMFERLVSMRPHPWGLLITFIELIRNEQYQFWQYDFVHCAPEIERLFASVANSCSVNLPTKFGSADANTGSVPA